MTIDVKFNISPTFNVVFNTISTFDVSFGVIQVVHDHNIPSNYGLITYDGTKIIVS